MGEEMKLSEVRTKLLGQHATLREIAARTLVAADRLRAGAVGARQALRTAIVELEGTLELHNADEESLLGHVIAQLDAWGKERRRLMDEHHAHEHAAMRAALVASAGSSDVETAATGATQVVNALLEHMAHEEKEILSANVLRDDICTVDPFGG